MPKPLPKPAEPKEKAAKPAAKAAAAKEVAKPAAAKKPSTADILAAAGIGAILAPPVMGAAAFLIAEFLNLSYFEVVKMDAIPACLYYLSIVITVEADSRRLELKEADIAARSITAYGRYYIQDVIGRAQHAGFQVLYGDTDSVFLGLHGKSKPNAFQRC